VTGDAGLTTVAKADQTYSMYDLRVNPGTANAAFVSKQGVSGTDNNGAQYHAVKTVTFAVQLVAALQLGGGSMVLASMAGPPSVAGTMSLVVGPNGALSLQYTDTDGSTKTLASTFMLSDSNRHTISIDRAYTNDSSGRAPRSTSPPLLPPTRAWYGEGCISGQRLYSDHGCARTLVVLVAALWY